MCQGVTRKCAVFYRIGAKKLFSKKNFQILGKLYLHFQNCCSIISDEMKSKIGEEIRYL